MTIFYRKEKIKIKIKLRNFYHNEATLQIGEIKHEKNTILYRNSCNGISTCTGSDGYNELL